MSSDDSELQRRREAIDALDAEILARLSARAAQAQAIGKLKGGALAYRPEREAQVLARAVAANPGPLSGAAVSGVFRQIMSACLALEQQLVIAYLGPAGTFSHTAVAQHFGQFVDARPCASIDDVFRAAESGQADFAVVPVENSTEGAIGRTHDLISQTPLAICGETRLRIRQNLLSNMPALSAVTKVYSHAQSLAQCARWLGQNLPGVPRVAVASNADAARLAANEPGAAAIAGETAAAIYAIAMLAPHIEDEPNNTTRFWVLGRQDVAASGHDLTSLVVACPNRPGALVAVLAPLARHGVSMCRLESRPSRTGIWEYLFFIDLEGHRRDEPVRRALEEIATIAPLVKVFGSYPAPQDPEQPA